ncbi:MAG: fatty acid desaturase [Chloroflexota bacterium]
MTSGNQFSNNLYAGWQKVVSEYQKPDIRTSIWQVINSYGGYFAGLSLMYFSLSVGYWLTLLLSIPTAGFLMRIFIIQHDCGHGSFFKSRQANDIVGTICGTLTLIPYRFWRRSHAIHHSNHAELEERGTGDIWTLTIDEYIQSARWKRIAYRVFRNPFFLFIIAPTINFAILSRFTYGVDWAKRAERISVHGTNLAIAGWLAAAVALIGLSATVGIVLPVVFFASGFGTFLFYVQHQFEETYWEHTPDWDFTLAALEGSSYYELPLVLQWFTGNIGFHHIHHLSPRIPNYKLQRCHEENVLFQQAPKLTLWSSLKTTSLALWDENQERLVSFREALEIYYADAAAQVEPAVKIA